MGEPWFRTTDMLRWGAANSGGNLTAQKFDENNWYWLQRVRALEAAVEGGALAGVDDVTLVGTTLTFTMTDYTTHSVTIPVAYPNFRDDWQPLTNYAFFDWFTEGGVLYQVQLAHTSAASFDPAATLGGHEVYRVLLRSPDNVLPTGGATGQVLAKVSGTDYDVAWRSAAVPTGGAEGQILRKLSGADLDFAWEDDDAAHVTATNSSGALQTVQEVLDDLGVNKIDQTAIDDSIATAEATTIAAAIASAVSASDTADAANLAAALVTVAANLAAATSGVEDLWIPSTEFTPRTTNGPSVGTVETSTNKVMIKTLDFDATTQEFAQFDWRPPNRWDQGTFTVNVYWSHASTSTNFGVVFGVDAVCTPDGHVFDVAFGTAQTVTDTGGTTDELFVSPVSAAITPAGTLAATSLMMIRVHRDPANGSDTLAVDARLHGIKITYGVTEVTDN